MRLAIIALAAVTAAVSSITVAAQAPTNLPPAPAAGAGLPSGQCFRSHDIRNHTVVGRNTLLLRANGRAVYRVDVAGSCLAGAMASDPIITRNPPGAEIICRPIDMDLAIARPGSGRNPCIVESISKLSPEQVAALPKRLQP
jgi:hypothetical protein